MADVGDFEDVPACECPYVFRVMPPQTPTIHDVGDFEAIVCVCPTAPAVNPTGGFGQEAF